MSTMPMSAADPRRHGHDTFVDEVMEHLEVLHRVALRLTSRPQDAEDLVQETATRALTRRAQYQPGTNLRAWLLTIERSLFVDAYRRARRGLVTQRLDEVEEES
jgi:RNA polymerase sigma-70 factor (ECF subfamily)